MDSPRQPRAKTSPRSGAKWKFVAEETFRSRVYWSIFGLNVFLIITFSALIFLHPILVTPTLILFIYGAIVFVHALPMIRALLEVVWDIRVEDQGLLLRFLSRLVSKIPW
jgi:hypothetical protein